MGFSDDIDNDKKGGDFYTMKEGEQRFRIMSEPAKKVERYGHGICYPGAAYCTEEVMRKEYNEKVAEAKKAGKDPKSVNAPSLSTKYMAWAILRGDGKKVQDKFVILQLPKKLAEKVRMWMTSEEYGFEAFPMPYDLTIVADENVGTTKVKYDILAARKETPVTEEETVEFEKLTPIKQIIERLQAKQKEKTEGSGGESTASAEYPTEEISPEDIPFN
jgi:hypothetical protein